MRAVGTLVCEAESPDPGLLTVSTTSTVSPTIDQDGWKVWALAPLTFEQPDELQVCHW